MSNYAKGAARERELQASLKAGGWVAYRSAGSHGCADVIAFREGHKPLLIQLKSGKGSPFSGFPPAARAELSAEARKAGGTAVLVFWQPRKPKQWFFEEVWPDGR